VQLHERTLHSVFLAGKRAGITAPQHLLAEIEKQVGARRTVVLHGNHAVVC
jgi:hypothetical protein